MRFTLKHRVLTGKARKGWHSFFIEIFDRGERKYESLDMVADPADKANQNRLVEVFQRLEYNGFSVRNIYRDQGLAVQPFSLPLENRGSQSESAFSLGYSEQGQRRAFPKEQDMQT